MKNIEKQKVKGKPKLDRLAAFFGSMKTGREALSPTTETIEKHLTSGPIQERTDLKPWDIQGIAYLMWLAEVYKIPEAKIEADIWREHFISRDRMGRLEAVEMIKSKIASELELAKIKGTVEALGRERK
jgi:hypothetical protein